MRVRKSNAILIVVALLAGLLGVAVGANFAVQRAAASTPTALINGDTVVASSDQPPKSDEQIQAEADGFSVTVVNGTTWDSMTESQFQAYNVLIIGDPSCGDIPPSVMSNVGTWTKAVMDSGGNKFTIGSDPVDHSGADSTNNRNHIIKDGIAYAGSVQGATGAYVDTSCEFDSNNTTILNDLSANTSAWTVQEPTCSGNIGIISSNPAFSHTTDTDLSGWNCSSHADYPTWSSEWTPFAISADAPTQTYCGTDIYTGSKVCGEPYIFFAGQVGVIPQGAAPGADLYGGGSPSEARCSCDAVTALDPVQLSTGDFVEKATDLTVPGTGIPLSFTRTYDAIAAQKGLGSIAPGSTAPDLGAGWFDNFDMSLVYNPADQVATITEENGAQVAFQQYAPTTSVPPWCPSGAPASIFCSTAPRVLGQLVQNSDGSWTYTRRQASPLIYTFDTSGVLSQISDQQHDTISSSPYAGSACPTGDSCTVWSEPTASDSLVIADAMTNGSSQVQKVFELNSGLAASYSTSTSTCSSPTSTLPELCSAIQPGALTTTYSYNGTTNQMLTITPPTGGVVTNSYNGNQLNQQCVTPGGNGIPQLSTVTYTPDPSLVGGSDTTVTSYPDGPGSGCNIAGKPVTDTTVYKFSNDALIEVDRPGSSAASITRYQVDPVTLLPTNKTDGDNNVTRDLLQTYQSSGSQFTAANPILTFDGLNNTTQYAYTSDNLAWCQVLPAEYLNAVRCLPSDPSTPPSPGQPDQFTINGQVYSGLGMTLSFYDANNHLTASTDALGNTTSYTYTDNIPGVPNGLRYCSVDPVDYQKNVTCPSYGAAHVTGTQTESYDGSGNTLTTTDGDGNTTSYCYYYQTGGCAATAPGGGSGGNPQLLYSITDPDGTVTTYTYDAAGHVLNQVQMFGSFSATTVNAYTTGGLLYCTIAPLAYSQGHTTCPSPAPSSPPAVGSDPWQGATVTIYDNTGRPTYTVNPLGGVTEGAYDGDGNRFCTVAATAYANGVTCPASPPPSAPTVGNDPKPGATIITYDPNNRPVQVTNPLGGITQTVYDAAGNATQTTVEADVATTAAPNVVTATSFDADNRVSSTTVGFGTSSASTTKQSYDPDGNVYCSVSGNAVSQGSSAFQCPTWQASWITAPPNPTSLYSTTPNSAQANNVTTSFYDANGQLLQTTNPDVTSPSGSPIPDTTVTAVDGDGRTYCSADPTNVTVWLNGHAGATWPYLCPTPPLSTPPAQGSNPGYVTNIYDATGHLSSKTDQVGDTTNYSYDPNGRVASTADPRGKTTTDCYYHQNGTGQCAAVAPRGGGLGSDLYSTTTPSTSADPSGQTTTDTYYPGGSPDTTVTAAGTTTNGYDSAGDLASVTYTNTASGYTVPTNLAYTYNQDASHHTTTDASGTTTYSYDNAADLTQQKLAANINGQQTTQTTSYTYFNPGVRSSITYPAYAGSSSPQVNYTYDATGAMISETDWTGHEVTFGHDADGNQTNQANNVTSTNPTGTSSTSFAYDNADYNTTATSTLAQTCGGNETLTQSFTPGGGSRNPDGQVTQDQESYTGSCSNQSAYQRNYSYDPAGRVVYQGSATQGTNPNNYGYDPAGDPTTISSRDQNGNFDTYTQGFDNAGETTNQTPTAGSAGVASTNTYDTLGDLTRSAPSGAAGTNYAYNQAGQMTNVSSDGQQYNTVAPVRICDTRTSSPTNQCTGHTLGAGGTLNVNVTGTFGSDSIPSNAYAVVVNLTAVNNTAATSMQVYPAGATRPSPSSQLNDPAATTSVNNQVTAAVGAGGQVTVYNSTGSTDFLVDLVGYYLTPNGSGYTAMAGGPYRICDTRPNNPGGLTGGAAQCNGTNNTGRTLGTALNGNSETLQIAINDLQNGQGQLISPPSGADAVVIDLTAINPSTNMNLTAYDSSNPKPSTSSLNVPAGSTIDKEITVPLNSNQTDDLINITNNVSGSVDVTVDVEGYFRAGVGDPYNPVSTTRICDTRANNPSGLSGQPAQCDGTNNAGSTLAPGATLTIHATGTFGSLNVPANATAVVLSVTATNETGPGHMIVYPTGETLPTTSSLNYKQSTTVNNEVTTALGTNGQINIYNYNSSTDLTVDIEGYYMPPTITYTYNAVGLEAANSTVGNATNLLDWDTTGPLALLLTDNTNDYIYGPTGTPVEQIPLATSTPTYLTYTPSKSSWLSTNTAGDETGYWRYDAYGNLAYGTPTSPFGYSGQYTDATTGLVNDRARWYQPQTGEFTSRDPAFGETDTAYTYAGGDPVGLSDPAGLWTRGYCGSISVTAGLAILSAVGSAHGCLESDGSTAAASLTYGFTGGFLGLNWSSWVRAVEGDIDPLKFGGSAVGGVQVSDAVHVTDLAGQFNSVSVMLGRLWGGAITYFWGPSADGPVHGFDVEGGLALGASVTFLRTNTKLHSFSGLTGEAITGLAEAGAVTPPFSTVEGLLNSILKLIDGGAPNPYPGMDLTDYIPTSGSGSLPLCLSGPRPGGEFV